MPCAFPIKISGAVIQKSKYKPLLVLNKPILKRRVCKHTKVLRCATKGLRFTAIPATVHTRDTTLRQTYKYITTENYFTTEMSAVKAVAYLAIPKSMSRR